MTVLMISAAGTRIALLTTELLATAHTTGSSRSGCTPATCCALSARSSPSTPAVFLVATLVNTATSSRMLAMSSIRAIRLLPAIVGVGKWRRAIVAAKRRCPGPRASAPAAEQPAHAAGLVACGRVAARHEQAAGEVQRVEQAAGALEA